MEVRVLNKSMITMSDEELIRKAQNNNKQAFTILMNRYTNRIHSYIYKYVRDRQIAEDLTIQTFMNAYNRMDTYTEMGKFSAWIYTIAANCARREAPRRKNRREVSINETVDATDGLTLEDMLADERSRPDYTARESELKEFVYKAISELDDKYKKVLVRCDVDGLPNYRVAKILKTNVMTVGVRLKRARRLLYEALNGYGYDFQF